MEPTKFDWGSTRRSLMSILTPLLSMAAARWGWDPEKSSDLLNNVFLIADAVLAASGPLYAVISNIRAMKKDSHAKEVTVATLALQAPPGSLIAQATGNAAGGVK